MLNHILDLPELPAVVQDLNAPVLAKLIRHIGLEDSAEIVSLATAKQLKAILDEDLWSSDAPGLDETFDAERFGLWLEIMMQNGAAFAARKISELDEDLLTLGLCRLVLAVDIDDYALLSESFDDTLLEKALESSLNQEFGNYLVIAKSESCWDTVCALLAELGEQDYEMFTRLLERCCRVTGEYMEDNGGLYHVLTAGEMLEEDVSSARKERREAKGFVTPASAAVFLSQVRSMPLHEIIEAATVDPITRAYFRAAEKERGYTAGTHVNDKKSEQENPASLDRKIIQFIQTLQNAEVLSAPDQKLLTWEDTGSQNRSLPLTEAMRRINRTDPDLFSKRLMELSYLSNTLMSGCRFQGRPFKPEEAAEAALSVCNLGSEYLLAGKAKLNPEQKHDIWDILLKEVHLIKPFQTGWKILFDEVVFHTAKTLLKFMNRIRDERADSLQARELRKMADILRSRMTAGRPWTFVDEIYYLQIFLDGNTVTVLTGLLQEYPVVLQALTEKGKNRPLPFIGSHEDIATIRQFLDDAL